MNNDQIMGIVRTIIAAAVAYIVGKGWLPSNIVPADLVAAISTIVVLIWSVASKTNAATVAKAAAIVPIAPADQRAVGIDTPVKPTA